MYTILPTCTNSYFRFYYQEKSAMNQSEILDLLSGPAGGGGGGSRSCQGAQTLDGYLRLRRCACTLSLAAKHRRSARSDHAQ